MHIAEGVLPVHWAAAWAVPAAAVVAQGLRRMKRKAGENPARKPFYALIGASVFIISLLPIPVPIAGTSSHPCGTPLAAILLGPLVSTVMGGVALFLQALFFAHGGLTTLGANIVSEGIIGSFAGWSLFALGRRTGLPLFAAAFIAGFAGDLAVYLATSAELALALHGEKPLLQALASFFVAYLPTQGPLAVAEGLFTGYALQFVAQRRPDLLHRLRIPVAGVAAQVKG